MDIALEMIGLKNAIFKTMKKLGVTTAQYE
jgi:hypothetical protein